MAYSGRYIAHTVRTQMNCLNKLNKIGIHKKLKQMTLKMVKREHWTPYIPLNKLKVDGVAGYVDIGGCL